MKINIILTQKKMIIIEYIKDELNKTIPKEHWV